MSKQHVILPRNAFIERCNRFNHSIACIGKTFGNSSPYDFVALNISFSGLLLASAEALPFRIHSILELEVDPQKQIIHHRIDMITKVVRLAPEQTHIFPKYTYFLGLKIIEISIDSLKNWDLFLQSLGDTSHLETHLG
jgi:hypothetical protein